MTSHRRAAGFTLLEVLIALAIVAVGLGAAVRATIQVTSGAEQMKMRTLAIWVAEDRLSDSTARRIWSAPGVSSGAVNQGNVQFAWRQIVGETADPAFRSVGIEVYAAAQPDYVLARLTGFLAAPASSP